MWAPEVRAPAGAQAASMWSPQRLFQEMEPVELPEDDTSKQGQVTWNTTRTVCRHHEHGPAQGSALASEDSCWFQASLPGSPSVKLLPPCTVGFTNGICRLDSLTVHFSRGTKMFAFL